jgi:hypothetical protein
MPLHSSECFLAMIANIVLEVCCHYSVRWFNVGGSHMRFNLNQTTND